MMAKSTPEERSARARKREADHPWMASDRSMALWSKLSPEQRSEKARSINASMSAEERSERGHNASAAFWATMSPDKRSAKARNQNRARQRKSMCATCGVKPRRGEAGGGKAYCPQCAYLMAAGFRYGLSATQLAELFSDYRCRMCGDTGVDHRLHIDHDHATGIVRGLLCRRHNYLANHYDYGVSDDLHAAMKKYVSGFNLGMVPENPPKRRRHAASGSFVDCGVG